MTEKDLHLSYYIWRQYYAHRNCDHFIQPFLNESIQAEPPKGSWLRTVREGQFCSMESIAKRLNVSRMAYCKLEKSESSGSIRLSTLKRAAAVMDCELVYGLRPISKEPISKTVWKRLLDQAGEVKTRRFVNRQKRQPLKSPALSAVIRDLMNSVEGREQLGWTERK